MRAGHCRRRHCRPGHMGEIAPVTAETTYARYKRVLEEIANGVADAQERAEAALYPDKPEPNLAWKLEKEASRKRAQTRRDARDHESRAAYLDWLKAGRPPIVKYARLHGKSRSAMERLLRHGEIALGLPWKQQRLHWGNRNKTYDTCEEIFVEKYGHKPGQEA